MPSSSAWIPQFRRAEPENLVVYVPEVLLGEWHPKFFIGNLFLHNDEFFQLFINQLYHNRRSLCSSTRSLYSSGMGYS